MEGIALQAGAYPAAREWHAGVSTLDLRSRPQRPAEQSLLRTGRSRSSSAAGYRRFRDGRPPVPQPQHAQTPSPPRSRVRPFLHASINCRVC